MNEAPPETVEIRLLPYESTCLSESLEALSEEVGRGFPAERLATVMDRLDDSQAAASWLREYVLLELQAEEVVELMEAMAAALNLEVI